MRYLFLVLFVSGLLFFTSCMKKETYPDIPQIEFAGWQSVFDTGQFPKRGILAITFKDGNGDIGLNPADTFPPFNKQGDYYYNYVFIYYEKQMGTYVKIDLDPPFSARIPILTPDNPNKAIKGIIVDTLALNPHPLFDTIRFDLFIYDRALHKSNVVTTPDIILRRP
jgi:hypothetical protein